MADSGAITPVSTPLCECATTWEHSFFNCNGRAHLYPPDPDLETEGRVWLKRDEALIRMTRNEKFHLEQLRRTQETHDLWHALHHEKATLFRFLEGWHTELKRKWDLFRDEPDVEEQGITYVRGLVLLNIIVRLLLVKESQIDLFGAGLSRRKRKTLKRLLFDLTSVEKQTDGTFTGELKYLYSPSLPEKDAINGTENDMNNDIVNGTNGNSLQNGHTGASSNGRIATLAIREPRNINRFVEQESVASEDGSSQISPRDATTPNDVDRMEFSDDSQQNAAMKTTPAKAAEDKSRVDSGVGLHQIARVNGMQDTRNGRRGLDGSDHGPWVLPRLRGVHADQEGGEISDGGETGFEADNEKEEEEISDSDLEEGDIKE